MRLLTLIMGIKWKDRVTNIEVLERSGLTSIESMILIAWLCWTGHVIQIVYSHILHQLLYRVLVWDHRDQDVIQGLHQTVQQALVSLQNRWHIVPRTQ